MDLWLGLTLWPLEDVAVILKSIITEQMLRLSSWALPGIILWMRPANERWGYNVTSSLIGWACSQNLPCTSCESALKWMPQNTLIISQHWFRYWLGAISYQAITWANVDPDMYHNLVSLGHNELVIIKRIGVNNGLVLEKATTKTGIMETNYDKKKHQLLVLCHWAEKSYTETKGLLFWQICHQWLHWKLSFWQLPVQPMMTNLST